MIDGSVHDDDGLERPKRSWREIDQLRDGTRRRSDEPRPRGRAAEARAKRATEEYVKSLDGLFAKDTGGAEGDRLAEAIRDAHGSPGLAEACHAYLDALGIPLDPALLSLFLDAPESHLIREALRGLTAGQAEGGLEISGGLRSQLRMLAEDSDDEIAEAAEALLESL